jgi:uncharacterized protein YceK
VKKLITLGAIAMLALAGCSAIDSGTITQKDHHDDYYTTTMSCAAYSKQGFCTLYVPITTHHPESWRFDLTEGDKDGWVYVSEDTYSHYAVGDYFQKDES